MSDQEKPLHQSDEPNCGRNKWRSYLSQILASTIKNFLLFDLGLAISFPTIIIPALQLKAQVPEDIGNFTTSTLNPLDLPVESFYLSAEQVSWLGSIAFICQPLGGVASGWITEPWGRKRAMFIVNIPFVVAWTMMYFASSATQILIASVLMGIGVGFMEAAVITYIGEIAEPAIRGLLASCTNLSVTLGVFVIYYLGSVVDWRAAALICLGIPFATAIAILFVPETPSWLLSKGRRKDAIQALCWLRGWTTEENVMEEFQSIEEHLRRTNICGSCSKKNLSSCEHSRSSFGNRFKELFSSATMKPFLIVSLCSGFSHLCGVSAYRQFFVQIYEAYDVPLNPRTATVYTGLMGLFGNFVLLLVLKKIGKRSVCMISLIGSGICGAVLGIYAMNVLSPGQTSFDNSGVVHEGKGLFPMVVLFIQAFLFYFGVFGLPWMLLSEIFPFKTRGLATGISSALNYVFAFIAIKTYLDVERSFGLIGTPWFYAAFAFAGAVTMFYILPETEGLTLVDIERHFSERGRRLTDRFISKYSPVPVKDLEGNGVSASLTQ